MNVDSIWTDRGTLAGMLFFVLATALVPQTACGEELPTTEAAVEASNSQPPSRSVLEDSYRYHRLGELPEKTSHLPTARDGGSYRYGFPVETHRWGWFGAEHYYPRVLWHRGYYGDRSRWSYRRGY